MKRWMLSNNTATRVLVLSHAYTSCISRPQICFGPEGCCLEMITTIMEALLLGPRVGLSENRAGACEEQTKLVVHLVSLMLCCSTGRPLFPVYPCGLAPGSTTPLHSPLAQCCHHRCTSLARVNIGLGLFLEVQEDKIPFWRLQGWHRIMRKNLRNRGKATNEYLLFAWQTQMI